MLLYCLFTEIRPCCIKMSPYFVYLKVWKLLAYSKSSVFLAQPCHRKTKSYWFRTVLIHSLKGALKQKPTFQFIWSSRCSVACPCEAAAWCFRLSIASHACLVCSRLQMEDNCNTNRMQSNILGAHISLSEEVHKQCPLLQANMIGKYAFYVVKAFVYVLSTIDPLNRQTNRVLH